MVQKAKSLTDIFNLFKPMALKADQLDFYQETAKVRDRASYEYHDIIFERIENLKSPERLLVVGHAGSGKSTELQVLMNKLTKDSIPVIHIEAKDDLDLYNFKYIDILMLIVEKMVQYVQANNLKINKHILSAFKKALSTKITSEFWEEEADVGINSEASVSASIPVFFKVIARISSSLKMASGFKEELREEIKPKIYDVINSLNAFSDDISTQANKKVVIIIDGLEKCRQESVRKLFIEDIGTISNINAHMLIACPIAVYRSVDAAILSSYFSAPVVIPMIKTHNEDGSRFDDGIKVIRELILKRADASFFDEGVLDMIITSAGGSLRDTCTILSNSAFEAHMRKLEIIDKNSVEFTLNKYATDVFFRVNSKLYPRTKKIFEGDKTAAQDEELSDLLYCGAVFEYENGKRWVNIHPLVRQYIEKQPGVLDY